VALISNPTLYVEIRTGSTVLHHDYLRKKKKRKTGCRSPSEREAEKPNRSYTRIYNLNTLHYIGFLSFSFLLITLRGQSAGFFLSFFLFASSKRKE
jgi:hypothetical protein